MPTAYHGKNGVVKVGSVVIAETTKFAINTAVNTSDTTVQGLAAETHLPGIISWSGSLDCFFDGTDTTGQEVLIEGASVTLNLFPTGITTGLKMLSGTATITGVGIDSAVNGTVTRNIQFKGNGPLTRAAAP
jgi:hypothetical protein